MRNWNRRTWLRRTATTVGLSAVVSSLDFAEWLQKCHAEGDIAPLNRFSRMVQEWFVTQVRIIEDRENQRRSQLKTKEDAEAYVKSVQQRIRQSFGPDPEKTPLRPQVMGVVERDTYRIERWSLKAGRIS